MMMSTLPPNPAAVATAAVKKPPAPGAPPEGQYTRRDFLVLLGWGWLSMALGGVLAGALRFMFPNMLYEPNPVFKVGKPSLYPLGSSGESIVYTNWQDAQRVWIVSIPDGIYAFLAKCTHLGCTPRWEVDSQRFKCPCHGSNFNIEGDVVAGPAPVPLNRIGVSISQDGQLVLNKSTLDNNVSDRRKPGLFVFRKNFS
jgi:cytochrome b6-f complex iron-sulfur subunit